MEKKRKIVEQITEEEAIKLIKDKEYASKQRLRRIISVVRDPTNPEVILSLNICEAS